MSSAACLRESAAVIVTGGLRATDQAMSSRASRAAVATTSRSETIPQGLSLSSRPSNRPMITQWMRWLTSIWASPARWVSGAQENTPGRMASETVALSKEGSTATTLSRIDRGRDAARLCGAGAIGERGGLRPNPRDERIELAHYGRVGTEAEIQRVRHRHDGNPQRVPVVDLGKGVESAHGRAHEGGPFSWPDDVRNVECEGSRVEGQPLEEMSDRGCHTPDVAQQRVEDDRVAGAFAQHGP